MDYKNHLSFESVNCYYDLLLEAFNKLNSARVHSTPTARNSFAVVMCP